jgi:thiol-disulfide isomerase/thioredoxin
MDFDRLEQELSREGDTLYVINFWATWCKPCTEEMPDLVKIQNEFDSKKFKLLFVSLDMPSQLENRLLPFIKDYGIRSEVILLDDPDANRWINKVDDTWTGSIPATLIYTPGYRKFHEGIISYNKLKKEITKNLK